MARFLKGITAGAVIGAAVGMMALPEFDRGTKRKIKKTRKYMMNMAGDIADTMKHRMR